MKSRWTMTTALSFWMLFMNSCSTGADPNRYPSLGENGEHEFSIEELNAAERGGVYDYQQIADQALKRTPGSLDRFLEASLSMKFGAASSALHGFYTFPKVMELWGDKGFAESCKRLSRIEKQKIVKRMDRHTQKWREEFPLTSESLGHDAR